MSVIVLGIVLILVSSGCARKFTTDSIGGKNMKAKTIVEVLEAHSDDWMSIPGVVGTAIGEFEGKPCLKILVTSRNDDLSKRIPPQIAGFSIVIQVTGEFQALDPEQK